ncbi:hypothetical protein [Paraliomyxa miuraensis]|uniref:hypothetical protein n=1 Tax=Paraliomyxa miuraensis TaxID=376150 RepID=UPI0022512468|nr:hypothetical protein [Paraliomyxa miuraensis]MCX4246713.1 hypothetical protein [Paraliomyxa miuraensis]
MSAPEPDPGPATSSTARPWIDVVAIVLVCAVVYANALTNGYHLDDQYRIVENPELGRVWPIWRHFFDPATSSSLPTIVQFRPMLPLSLSITAWLSELVGLDPLVGHRLGNLGLHVAAALLVARLMTRLAARADPHGPSRALGLAAGLLYAVHPVAGVPVNYLCARDLLMMQVLLLGCLLVFVRLRAEGSSPWRWGLALGLLGLSLTSKTDAVVAPALVGAIDVAIFGASLRDPRTWARAAAFTVPVLAFFGWTELVLEFSDAGQLLVDRGPLDYPLTQARLHVFYYLRNAIWPFEMRVLPRVDTVTSPLDSGALVGVAVVVGSSVLAWRIRMRAPLLALCIAAYWIAFAPTSWVLPFRYLATDYRQVPSLPWLCAAVAWGTLRLRPRRDALVVLGLLVIYLGGASVLTNRVWRDERMLWGQSIRHGGETQAHLNYGRAVANDDPALAEAHYREALRQAPGNVFVLINLGMLEIHQRRLEEGISRLEQAASLTPSWPLTQEWLARGCVAARQLAGPGARPRPGSALARCMQRGGL